MIQPYLLSPSERYLLPCNFFVGLTISGTQNVVFRFRIIIKPSRAVAPIFLHWVFSGTFVQKIGNVVTCVYRLVNDL